MIFFEIVDIKVENLVLVDDSDSFPIKIIDFGMAIPMFRRDEVIYVAFIFEYSG